MTASDVVLDASAVLAVLNEENGAAAVEDVLPGALIGTVNLAEVLTKLAEVGVPGDSAWSAVAALGLSIVDFDLDTARTAADLRRATRGYGLSLGDRACLALGLRRDAVVMTADRVWLSLGLTLTIRSIR